MSNILPSPEESIESMKIIRAWIGDNPSHQLGLGPIRVIHTDGAEIHLWLGDNIIILPNRLPNKDEELTFRIQDKSFGVNEIQVTILNRLYWFLPCTPRVPDKTI